MNTAAVAAALAEALPDHLRRQRWYGGKGRDAAPVTIDSIETLQAPWPALVRVVVDCASPAGVDRYQLLLGVRPLDEGTAAHDPDATVCTVTVDGRRAECFDALADGDLAVAVLSRAAPSFVAHRARAIGVEQSNTSIVYDEALILKVFRRLASPNPDVEVTVGLARVGFDQVAEPLAVWRSAGDDLAILQPFLSDATDAWTLAVASARRQLEAAPDSDPGADLAGDVDALGAMTGRLHLALAEAFGTWPATPSTWADAALRRLGATTDPRVDRIGVAAAIEPIRGLDDAGRAIRVHGDYHLGQVLRARDHEWYVFDFEGEPARPVEERRAPSSPLRDVAGMLRSFSYAAGAARRSSPAVAGDEGGERLAAWEARLRGAFLSAYFRTLAGSPLLPDRAEAVDALLAAFEVDKAVYEVAYEQGSRPDWVDIPLDGLRRLLARGAG